MALLGRTLVGCSRRARRVRRAGGRCEDAEGRHHAASVLQLRREHRRRPRRDRAADRCRRQSARLRAATGRHDPHHLDGRARRERHRPRCVGVRDPRRRGLRDKLTLIYANDGVSLIPVAGDPSGDEGRQSAHVHLDDGGDPAGVSIARRLGRARPRERHVLPRQRAALRARDPQAARGIRRADRRREPRRTSAARRCTAATTTSCRSSGCR